MAGNPFLSGNEKELRYSDLFFSKTDLTGRLLFGNSTFIRIGGFSWSELDRKAHSIVRHPQMPRAVFKLFWSYLKAGKAISAFVKNRSKDGAHYWVFASAFPMDDFITSVRIKPSSEKIKLVEGIYSKMFEIEAQFSDDGITKATEYLLAQLKELGFESYDDFMTAQLTDELNATIENLGSEKKKSSESGSAALYLHGLCDNAVRGSEELFRKFNETAGEFKKIWTDTLSIKDALLSIEYCSINMSLQAFKLGASARSLHVVSKNFGDEARRVVNNLGNIESTYKRARKEANTQIYNFGAILKQLLILQSFLTQFSEESSPAALEKLFNEAESLRTLVEGRLRALDQSTQGLKRRMEELRLSFVDLSRLIRRLEGIYQIGSVEITRVDGDVTSLKSQLQSLQTVITQSSAKVLALNEAINKVISRFELIGSRSAELSEYSANLRQSLESYKLTFNPQEIAA